MEFKNKATTIKLVSFSSIPMRVFHITWFAFFGCFFAWFAVAPLMAVVRRDLGLTPVQVGNTMIASVAVTILARLLMGWFCDRIGPRLAYTGLLLGGSIPVMCIGLANSYESFLIFRLAIGAIGASFVITQYHTSVMFAPNVVGTANATTAGWGNLGGGITQIITPMLLTGLVSLGVNEFLGWRLVMIVPGVIMFITGIGYYLLTTDSPDGNFAELRASGKMESAKATNGSFWEAFRDHRVWALGIMYGACFGIELTINNIAALYFSDYFGLSLKTAGLIAGLHGSLNIFARALGGIAGDRAGMCWGLNGRARFLGCVLLLEGVGMVAFSQMTFLPLAIFVFLMFSLFVEMSAGATYAVVPFLNRKALGAVAGIVGAGGNIGAVAAGFLFRGSVSSWPTSLLILGVLVTFSASLALVVRFSPAHEAEVRRDMEARIHMQVPAREAA